MRPTDRLSSLAAERNRAPILDALRGVLPGHGRALEIASGSGQHVAWFARHLPGWAWQPTDLDAAAFASIAAWATDDAGVALPNVASALRLDVREAEWPVEGAFDAIVCANMLHIAPWECCAGLMRGAARHLAPDGVLVTYGPYLEDEIETAASNLAFDADLRRRDPSWGLRRRADVEAEAARAGLALRRRVALPANNLVLVFGRGASVAGWRTE